MGTHRVEIISSLLEFEQIRDLWNNLLAASTSETIFLTWEWLSSWCECFLDDSRKLFIITVYDENKLIGAAPLYVRSQRYLGLKLKCVEFLGTPDAGSDYLDAFTLKGDEAPVADTIYDFLMYDVRDSWDMLFLRDIRANSFFMLQFIRRMEEAGKYFEPIRGSLCPIIDIPADSRDFTCLLSSHKRAQFRRHLRLLEQQGTVMHDCLDLHRAAGAIDPFLSFYEQKKKYKNPHLLVFIKRFVTKAAETHWIRLDTLSVNGTCVGGLLHFVQGNKLLQYAMVTDKEFNQKVSIGDTLIGLVLGRTVPKGLKVYDFLKGLEDYKLRWANNIHPSFNFVLSQRRPLPIAFMMERFIRNAAKVLIR